MGRQKMVLPIATILIAVALAFGYSNLQRSRHHQVDQAALDAFQKKKGVTRQQVEDLLHQKNVDFTQSMGMGTYTNDDISTLGREPALAVCDSVDTVIRVVFLKSPQGTHYGVHPMILSKGWR